MSPLKKVRGFQNTGWILRPTGYNGKLYFTAHSNNNERETIFNGDTRQASAIWVTDGSEDGTRSLYDFAPGESTFVPTQQFNTANNRLFFQIRIDGEEGAGSTRTELWSYLDIDPTTNKEKLTKIAHSLPNTYRDHAFDDKTEAINGGLFFFKRPEGGEDELWFTNGEVGASNTYSLGGSKQHPGPEFVWLEGADSLLYFVADGEERVDGSDEPRWDPNELWVTSSTPGTFRKISDFDYQPLWNVSSPIHNATTIGDSLYFLGGEHVSDDKNYDIGPWRSDGTLESTKPFTGITPELMNDSSVPTISADHFTLFNGEIYFLARTGARSPYSESLYAYNPASEKTRFVAQTSDKWANFSSTRELFVFNDLMYFSGHTNETGWELWSSDGTSSGTGLVKDLSYSETNGEIISGIYDTLPQEFTIHKKNRSAYTSLDDELYFQDRLGKLWKIEAGSSMPIQVELPRLYSGVSEITSVDLSHGGSDLYFTIGQSIYKLDDQSTANPPLKPSQPSDVFRFYNPKSGVHFFTQSIPEKDDLISKPDWGYQYEGVAYQAPNSRGVELYRFFNREKGYHFMTASSQEADVITGKSEWGYEYEGRSFKVSSMKSADTPTEVHRFYHESKGIHFYSASEVEANNVITKSLGDEYNIDNARNNDNLLSNGWGYVYEGVAWYVC